MPRKNEEEEGRSYKKYTSRKNDDDEGRSHSKHRTSSKDARNKKAKKRGMSPMNTKNRSKAAKEREERRRQDAAATNKEEQERTSRIKAGTTMLTKGNPLHTVLGAALGQSAAVAMMQGRDYKTGVVDHKAVNLANDNPCMKELEHVLSVAANENGLQQQYKDKIASALDKLTACADNHPYYFRAPTKQD